MGKFRNIIENILRKIRLVKENKKIMVLDEPKGNETDPNKAFRAEQATVNVDTTPTFFSELVNARARVNELVEEDLKQQREENELYNELFVRNYKSRNTNARDHVKCNIVMPNIIGEMSGPVSDCILGLYENDPKILNPENRAELIETIKNSRTAESAQLNVQFLRDKIEKSFTKSDDGNILEYDISEDELINNILTYMLKSEESSRKTYQIIAEKIGLNYAFINSINDKMQLPEELKGKFEDKEDYVKKEKASILEAIKSTITTGSKTPSEEKALTAMMEKMLEKDGLQGDWNLNLDTIKSLISKDMQMGEINPGVSRYTQDLVKQVLTSVIKGAEQIRPNNKENTKFMYYDENREGPYRTVFYEGKVQKTDIVQE